MVGVLREIPVQYSDQIIDLFSFSLTQRFGHDGKGVGYAVLAVIVGKFRHGIEGRERPVDLAVVHGIRPRRERFARLSAVGRRPRLFTVNHVGSDGQRGKRMFCAAVRGRFAQLFVHLFEHLLRDGIHAVVIVAEFRKIARRFEIDDNSLLVFDRFHLRVLYGGKRVRYDGKPRDAERHQPFHIGIVQRHLQFLIGVFIVHEVNDVHGIDVCFRQPCEVKIESLHHLAVLEHLALVDGHFRPDLHEITFVDAAVQRHEQGFGQVAPRTEKLHLLAHFHAADAAGDGIIVAPLAAHEIVVFILYGIRFGGNARGVSFEIFGQSLRPKHREVGLGRAAEIIKRMQKAEGIFGYERLSVLAHAAHAFGNPHRISGKKLVIFRRSQMPHCAQFDDEVIDDFLHAAFA